MNPPLLLIVGSGDPRYREYLLRSIAEHYRVELLLGSQPTWEREYITGCTVVTDWADTIGVAGLTAAARALAAREPIQGVLSWDEARVLQSAKVAAALGLPGGDPAMVMRCRDKLQSRQALDRAGVGQPRWALAGDLESALAAAGTIGYPVVLKPRALAASLGVVRVDGPDELRAHFAFTRDATVPGAWQYDEAILVEQFLAEPEISVDSTVHKGQVRPLCVARKEVGFAPYFEETGHLVDGSDPLLTDAELTATLRHAHAAIGFTDGVTHTELKLTAGGPKVIEINARLGGGLIPYLGRRATGVDPGLCAAAVACGRPPDLTRDRSAAAGVRFFYAERDDTEISDVTFDREGLPPAVDRLVPLASAGQVLSPPPKGTAFDRLALATAVAANPAECRAALDAAQKALRVAEEYRS